MLLSALFPTRDIGNDPARIRDWAQAAEDLGYAYIEVPDHVFGAAPRATGSRFTARRSLPRNLHHARLPRRGHQEDPAVERHPHRAAAPDRAHRQAGGRSRYPERRPAEARHRRRLEPRRIRGARHRLEDARRAAGRADRGVAPAVVRGPGRLRRPVSQSEGGQHRAAAGAAADPDLVRRLVGGRGQAGGPARRWLDADHGAGRGGRAEARDAARGAEADGRDPAKFGIEGWLRMRRAGPASVGCRGGGLAATRRRYRDALSDVSHARSSTTRSKPCAGSRKWRAA